MWDDDNRIQSVFDNGHEKTYKYDDQGERVIKRGPQGETAYINQWYTVRNREIASKHVWAGTTRIATSLVPGVKTGSFAPGNGTGNGKGHANGQANAGTGTTASAGDSKLPSTAQQAPGILKGSGLAHRSAQAAANSRNLEKNPHYATSGGGADGSAGGDTSAPGTASNQDNFLYYYHPDHLGSTGNVTDATGKIYEHVEYFPFGETWVQEHSNTQRTPYLFTGKELDEETGLYYFGARYYDPRVSVWQSPDPALSTYLGGHRNGGIYNSLNLSLLIYSYQNPIRFLDPDGMTPLNEAQWAHLRAETKAYEGAKNFMYADTKGYVTIGVGQMLPNAAAAAHLDLVNTATGKRPTGPETTSAYDAVSAAYAQAMSKGGPAPGANKYAPLTTLRMSDAAIDAKLDSSMKATQAELRSIFKGFDDFPAEAQMGLMDMGFNLGASNIPKKFPSFTGAVRSGDWAKAARESHRNGIQPSRNSAVRQLFEAAANSNGGGVAAGGDRPITPFESCGCGP